MTNGLIFKKQTGLKNGPYLLGIGQEVDGQVAGSAQLSLAGQVVGVSVASFTNVTGF